MRRLAALMIGVALAASACGGSGAGTQRTMTGNLTIANLQPFSGADADFGSLMYAGCYAAIQLINRAGGALGHSLDCVKVDTRSEAESGELARSMLASTPNLVAVLGPGSNEAPSTVPLINRAHVPMFTDAGQAVFDRSTYAYLPTTPRAMPWPSGLIRRAIVGARPFLGSTPAPRRTCQAC